jgi:hypothetical protein
VKTKEGSTSFLKKRSKKLLPVAASILFNDWNRMPDITCKGFLVLIFKKELLPFFL